MGLETFINKCSLRFGKYLRRGKNATTRKKPDVKLLVKSGKTNSALNGRQSGVSAECQAAVDHNGRSVVRMNCIVDVIEFRAYDHPQPGKNIYIKSGL